MKRFFLSVMFVFMFTATQGCDSHSTLKCYQSVLDKYPEDEVLPLPGFKYTFIVITDTSILCVKTINIFDHDVSDSIPIKRLNRNL